MWILSQIVDCFYSSPATSRVVPHPWSGLTREYFLRLPDGAAVSAQLWEGPEVRHKPKHAQSKWPSGGVAQHWGQYGQGAGPAGEHALRSCVWSWHTCRSQGESLLLNLKWFLYCNLHVYAHTCIQKQAYTRYVPLKCIDSDVAIIQISFHAVSVIDINSFWN